MQIFLSLACVAIGLYMVVLSYWTVKDCFTPWSLYAVAWSLMFGVFFLDLINYRPVSPTTWPLFILATVGFYVGVVCAFVPTRHQLQGRMPERSYWHQCISEVRLRNTIYALFFIGVIGHIVYLAVVDRFFGISALWDDPGSIRTFQSDAAFINAFFWGKFLWYVNWLVCVLVVFYMTALQKRFRLDMALVFLLALLTTVTSLERGALILIAIWSVLTLVYIQQSMGLRSQRNGITAITVAGIVALSFFLFQGTRLGKTDAVFTLAGGFNIPLLSDRPIYSPFVSSYVYLTGNVPAFDQYVNTTEGFTWGTFSLLPFFKILTRLLNLDMALPAEVGIPVHIPFPFNTYTYLNSAYSDFGVVGLFLYPLVVGFLATRFYVRMRHQPSLGNTIGAALIGHGMLLSVSTNRFVSTPFWEFVILLFIISKIVHQPQRRGL